MKGGRGRVAEVGIHTHTQPDCHVTSGIVLFAILFGNSSECKPPMACLDLSNKNILLHRVIRVPNNEVERVILNKKRTKKKVSFRKHTFPKQT